VNTELGQEQQCILDAIVDGVYGVDAEGKITFCNDVMLQMTGYTKQEIIGKDGHMLLHHTRPDGSAYAVEECAFRQAAGGRR